MGAGARMDDVDFLYATHLQRNFLGHGPAGVPAVRSWPAAGPACASVHPYCLSWPLASRRSRRRAGSHDSEGIDVQDHIA